MSKKEFTKKKTDAQWIAELFTEDMTEQQKYEKLSNLFFMTHNSEYCESMAGELASAKPGPQALWWEEVCQYKLAIEEECQRLKRSLELYEGEIDEEGRPHGKGTKYYLDGMRYEGQWKHGQKDGFGIRYCEDGTKNYEGTWKNDQIYGCGVLMDYRNVRYEGFFEEKPPYGEYGLSLEQKSVVTFPKGEVVEGPIDEGWYRCTYPNGAIFQCERFTTPGRGAAYPQAMGKGTYRFANGGVLKGRWDFGKHCDGDFEYTAPNGAKEIWTYKDDEVISTTPCQE